MTLFPFGLLGIYHLAAEHTGHRWHQQIPHHTCHIYTHVYAYTELHRFTNSAPKGWISKDWTSKDWTEKMNIRRLNIKRLNYERLNVENTQCWQTERQKIELRKPECQKRPVKNSINFYIYKKLYLIQTIKNIYIKFLANVVHKTVNENKIRSRGVPCILSQIH